MAYRGKSQLIDYNYVSPTQVTREEYEDVGTNFYLGNTKRGFKGGTDLEIWTAVSGGTQLTEGVDYELTSLDSYYSSLSGYNIYNEINMLNATYQTGSVFITYKIVFSYVMADSSGGGGYATGTPTNLGRKYIDGVTNAIDTNISLFVSDDQYEINKLVIVNTNNVNVNVSAYHVDGAVGVLTDADTLLPDISLEPNETKVVEIPAIEDTHTIVVKSDTTGVNFKLSGRLVDSVSYKRLAALDIDGVTNAIDTDILAFLTDANYTDVSFYVANRNAATAALVRIYGIDAAVIGSLADEDIEICDDTVLPNETVVYEAAEEYPEDNVISFMSDITDVNIIIYGRVVE